jgi:hypothetical protein
MIENSPLNHPNPSAVGCTLLELELELELIQTRMIQKPLLWVEVGKSACVLVGISLPFNHQEK